MDKEKSYLKRAITFRPENNLYSVTYSILEITRCFLSLDILYAKIQAKCDADATFREAYVKQIAAIDKSIIDRDAAQIEDAEDWEPGNQSEDWYIDDLLTELNQFLQHNPDLYREAFRNKEKRRTDHELREIKAQKEEWDRINRIVKNRIYPLRPFSGAEAPL